MGVLDTIKRHEGLRLKVYRCPANKLSIGYGRNLEDNGISADEAEMMLWNDVSAAEEDIRTIFPIGPPGLNMPRMEVLIDMRYQLGSRGFRGFKKMIAAIHADDWTTAAIEVMDSDYARQCPERARENAEILKNG